MGTNIERDIREGNKIIGEFMGAIVDLPYPYNKHYGQQYFYDFQRCDMWPENQRFHTETNVKYHKSWDWLMTVINKIENTHIQLYRPNVTIGTTFVRIDDIEFRIFDDENKIEIVWDCIVHYILKFNKNA